MGIADPSCLAGQDVPLTYTSFKVNEYQGFLADNGRQLNLVDFPGSERLRKQLFSKYLHERRSSLKAVVFVVDSSTFGRKARDVAELFYDALYESGKQVPFLVACSKQDSSTAKSAQAIRSALEREFGLINGTRSAALETTNGDREKRTLTDSGKNFQWSDLSSTGVEFVECCAVSDREEEIPDLEPIKKWISNL
ncbi:hypothetical protein AB6A40_001876 [Gnathostoma spinigerum]|uniref:Signal recognition particle receptor subunit beta n=1 Tax=Gnathostoma spinigerum TaxID=75299 RepID=A0ABD6EEQ6_9BILA